MTEYETAPAPAEAAPAASVVVMKFGGTSVGDIDRLRAVAARLVAARDAGHRVVGVLSAMGDTTDELLELAHRMSPTPKPRAVDMLISVGERTSCALAEMAIEDLGRHAVSLTGSQAGIVTDTVHGRATIVDVRAWRVQEALDAGRIVLVAGFQGVSTEREVTTLGRGGSNLTAVALAAALGADSCEMRTDVDGVFTADPRLVPDARRLEGVTWAQMRALADAGAQVLQARSVEYARERGVHIHVRSAFNDAEGTWIVDDGDGRLDTGPVAGIAQRPAGEGRAQVTVVGTAPELRREIERVFDGLGLEATVEDTTDGVACHVPAAHGPDVVRALHAALRLDVAPAERSAA
jgi:aspartate kinase